MMQGKIFLLGFALGAFLALCFISSKGTEAIEKGYAYYHPVTKDFTWKTREEIAKELEK